MCTAFSCAFDMKVEDFSELASLVEATADRVATAPSQEGAVRSKCARTMPQHFTCRARSSIASIAFHSQKNWHASTRFFVKPVDMLLNQVFVPYNLHQKSRESDNRKSSK